MWVKGVLLGYFAASLVVTIITASSTKDGILSKRQHFIEQLNVPSLEHRQLPVGNQTSFSRDPPATSAALTISSAVVPSDVSKTSSFIQSSSARISSESTTLATSATSTLSSARSTDTPFESSSSSRDFTNPSSFLSTQVTALPSATNEQSPSTSSSTSEPLTDSSISTLVDAPPTVSLTMEEVQTPSTTGPSTSTSKPAIESTRTNLQVASSSVFTSPSLETSASVSTGQTVRPPPETIFTPTSDGEISNPTPSSQSLVPTSSVQAVTSEIITTTDISTSDKTPTETPSSQQPSTTSHFSFGPISTAELSTIISKSPIPSSLAVESSSSTQETITTSVSGQTSVSALAPDLTSNESPQVSPSDGISSLISELQPNTMTMTSIAETASTVTTAIISEEFFSTQITSTIQESLTSSPSNVAGMSTPTFLTSISKTLPTPPLTGLPQPISSTDVSSSDFIEPLPPSSAESTSIASSSSSSKLDVAASSAQTLDSLPIIQMPSSSVTELSLSSISMQSTTSLVVASENPIPVPATTHVDISLAITSTTWIYSLPTTSESLSSQAIGTTSSLVDGIPSTSTSTPLASFITSMPLSPIVGSLFPTLTSEVVFPTEPIAASRFSSLSSMSDIVSSFATSETLIASITIQTATSASSEGSESNPLVLPSSTSILSGIEPTVPDPLSTSVSSLLQPTSNNSAASKSLITQSPDSSTVKMVSISIFPSLSPESLSLSTSMGSVSRTSSLHNPTTVVSSMTNSTAGTSIPTSEEAGSGSTRVSLGSSFTAITTPSGFFIATSTFSMSTTTAALPSSIVHNSTQTLSSIPKASEVVTATFSTVYVSSFRPSTLDASTAAFSLFSSVAEAAVNHNKTTVQVSSEFLATLSTRVSSTLVPASETLITSAKFSLGANFSRPSTTQLPLSTSIGFPGNLSSIATKTPELGITFSRSLLPTDAHTSGVPHLNKTQAVTLQTSSVQSAINSTTLDSIASITSEGSSTQTITLSSTSTSGSDNPSTTESPETKDSKTTAAPEAPSQTPSETAAVGSPPPLTTSQTAGVAVGATTGLLIAVVAAVFIARRYHAAKQGKRMSTGSVYPKVAYLYDPKTGSDGGDAEALIAGTEGGIPPDGPAAGATQGSSRHMERHSMGALPVARFTDWDYSPHESIQNPATHRRSDHVRLDTARALSAAVAGYGAAPRHSSSYNRYQSDVTNTFSDHIVPSPTFAPFSPDDIRRPELKPRTSNGRGEHSQMPISTYSYLNTAASMYPPISPYERHSTQGLSPLYATRRHTVDSDPFADPFEHDLLLQVDERNRTSDSVTVFASSPNLISPRTPRTPVGPKLPVRQPNGMTSARSLLSPVAAKYMHKAQEVKIPRKSIASPVLVQVGRSPVIKPFSPPPAAPEHRGWDEIKRHSEKHFSDEKSVPAPLQIESSVIQRKPVPASHVPMKPSLTGAGPALLAGNGLPLTVNIPHMYKKSVGLDVPRVHGRPDPAHESLSSDPVVREKRSRELRFADPTLIGKEF